MENTSVDKEIAEEQYFDLHSSSDSDNSTIGLSCFPISWYLEIGGLMFPTILLAPIVVMSVRPT